MKLSCRAAGILLMIAVAGWAQSPTATSPRQLPVWAYPVAPAAATTPDNRTLKHIPGSAAGFTEAQLVDRFNAPDWFPDRHPKMPPVVAHGRPPAVYACGHCHLPNGLGRPENSSVAGLPKGYIIEQMANFRSGLRKGSDLRMPSVAHMIQVAKAVTPEEVESAADYFSSLSSKPWIRVVETDRVPVTRIDAGMLLPVKNAGTEPIGQRVIEVPENVELTDLRDTASGFIAYVPPGSLKRGAELVWTGGDGKTIRCTVCHGMDLKGLGNVPSIAGRSPSQMARQIIDIQDGARNGAWDQLMKQVVAKLTTPDIVAITAYLASRPPGR